jgi:MoaA/NifB/PqqE/SkfB family radical SAM enzyme
LPCPYIHTKLGNIKEKPLKEILKYAFSFDVFNKLSSKCLVGEDINFAKKYLNKKTSVLNPLLVEDFLK